MPGFVDRVFLLLIVFLLSISLHAQQVDFKSDIVIINQKLAKKAVDAYKRPFITNTENKEAGKTNPLTVIAGGPLYVYQNVISRHISSKCLYTPSCSQFSKEAIYEYGLLKGTLLSIDRLSRCNSITGRDLRKLNPDQGTKRFPDPVSKYKKPTQPNGD